MLKNFILKNPFQLFLTILLPFLLSTLLVIFAQSSFLNRNFENFALNLVYNQQKTDLQNTSRNVSTMEQTVRSISTTAYFDETMSNLLYNDINLEEYSKYITKLESYKNIYPLLQSIYIYNGRHIYATPNGAFDYDRSSFEDKGIFPILDDIQHHSSHSIVLRKIPSPVDPEKMINVYSYLFFDSQLQSGKVSEAIILNIREDSIRESISSSDPNSNNFIIDNEGKLLSNDGAHPLLSNIKDTNYVKWINSNKDKTGNVRMDVNGVDSFVTYVATDVFDWKLISITPYDYIVKDVENMKKRTYLFVLCFIAGSILLSFYFSRRLYIPIKLVIQNYNVLESEKRNEFHYRKQDFLRKMIVSNDHISVDYINKKFKKFNIILEPFESFMMILIKVDRFSEFCDKFKLTDRALLKYGIVNIISELLSKDYSHECIEIEEDQILVLLQYKSSEFPSKKEYLVSLINKIQHNTEKFLNISTSFTFSASFETLNDLSQHYLNTLDLSYNRLIFGYKSFIFHENVNVRADEFKYPQELDKKMTDSLIQGQIDEAKKALADIIAYASQYSFTMLNAALVRLLLSVRYAIEVLESSQSIKVDFNWNIYLSKLQKIETMDQIQADFYHLFENLADELDHKKDHKYIKLLDDVIHIIHKEFANPVLALDLISEKVNLSPSYLGKLFKKHRMISITDYINNFRLAHASDLITSSDETINVIMERSGFLSRSHFFTLFKKAYGVTPNQYRGNAKVQ